jgi:repressor LexA
MTNGSATVKRFFKEEGRVRLQPENDTMPPIYVVDVDILGKVIGLIRNY